MVIIILEDFRQLLVKRFIDVILMDGLSKISLKDLGFIQEELNLLFGQEQLITLKYYLSLDSVILKM